MPLSREDYDVVKLFFGMTLRGVAPEAKTLKFRGEALIVPLWRGTFAT
jgi:hypothetical protein